MSIFLCSKIFQAILVLPPKKCFPVRLCSTQYALLTLIERWKFCLDKQGFDGVLLTDLSKAFDTINYELLIAKLHVYRFSADALEVLLSYLPDRWMAKGKDQYNCHFLDSITSRNSARISSWSHTVYYLHQ